MPERAGIHRMTYDCPQCKRDALDALEKERNQTMETQKIDVWDDADGFMYAQGHHEPSAFMAAVNAYIDECGVRSELEKYGVTYDEAEVEQLWFTGHPTDEEQMLPANEGDQDAFPVTRLQPH